MAGEARDELSMVHCARCFALRTGATTANSAVCTLPPRPRARRGCGLDRRVGGAVLCILFALGFHASDLAVAQDPPPKVDPPNAQTPDDELGKRLIRRALDIPDDDLMAAIIRLMHEAAQRLEVEFDAGEPTQALQQRVMDQLDDAIKEAAARRRKSNPENPGSQSDKRQRPPPAQKQPSKGKAQRVGDTPDPTAQPGGPADDDPLRTASGGELKESRRGWGHLPQREREEIIQGVGENYLERYRAWIERYYRALQEAGE